MNKTQDKDMIKNLENEDAEKISGGANRQSYERVFIDYGGPSPIRPKIPLLKYGGPLPVKEPGVVLAKYGGPAPIEPSEIKKDSDTEQ